MAPMNRQMHITVTISQSVPGKMMPPSALAWAKVSP